MREIKFRVWDADNKRMIILDGCKLYSSDNDVKLVMGYDFHDDMSDDEEITHYTLLQFTGLKDRLGKELYEGDIIEIEGTTAQVVFWERPPEFGLKCRNEEEWYDWKLTDDCDRMVIIGNIYEHPEIATQSIYEHRPEI